MTNTKVLTSLLIELFGLPRNYNDGQVEVDFNCPKCDDGRNKFNLSCNTIKRIFQCWSCGYSGKLKKLLYDYGSASQQERYRSEITRIAQDKFKQLENISIIQDEIVSLDSFRSLKFSWDASLHYKMAMKYLRKRKIDENIINERDLCYCESGKYKDRIIVPSKNARGGVDYFVGRAFYDATIPKYKNPKVKKTELIFGEKFIDWSKPVIITEGVFDAIVVYNAVPILGTNIKGCERLVRMLVEHRSHVILAFDGDDVGIKKAKEAGNYLAGLGVHVDVIKHDKYNDLSEVHEKEGKKGVVKLLKTAQTFDPLELAIRSLK